MQRAVTIGEVERVRIWVLTDNYYDALRPDNEVARRYRVVPGECIHAEHGLAYYLETVQDGKSYSCMFDFGLDPSGVINNAALLGLDLGKVSAFVLSHGHFDHWTGAEEILELHQSAPGKRPPFYVGEDAFLHRYSMRPGTDQLMDIGQLDKGRIEALGVQVIEIGNPTMVIPGAWSTGKIERITDYETVPRTLLVKRGAQPEPDLFWGEQAIFVNVKDKGLIVLSGCAHAGIVNTIHHARKISGISKVHAVIGGFHLINAKPEIIQKTISDIEAIDPDFIAPAHCTGFEAIVAISRNMPDKFILNTAGTRYDFPSGAK
jgi:7,8-dihydropterin-6-yl-methyl-4-(beta-D-ribofuranosyl)aminobenzene 5'-phosphate synthase